MAVEDENHEPSALVEDDARGSGDESVAKKARRTTAPSQKMVTALFNLVAGKQAALDARMSGTTGTSDETHDATADTAMIDACTSTLPVQVASALALPALGAGAKPRQGDELIAAMLHKVESGSQAATAMGASSSGAAALIGSVANAAAPPGAGSKPAPLPSASAIAHSAAKSHNGGSLLGAPAGASSGASQAKPALVAASASTSARVALAPPKHTFRDNTSGLSEVWHAFQIRSDGETARCRACNIELAWKNGASGTRGMSGHIASGCSKKQESASSVNSHLNFSACC